MVKGTAFWRKLYFELANEVEQVLGKALGYPKYSDGKKNFPGTTEADGVCVGEHVPESLLSEAAKKLRPSFRPSFRPSSWAQDWVYNPASLGGVTVYPINPPSKTLVFDKMSETPCTAEIEVAFEKLASYFEKRAKENARRSEKEENAAASNAQSFVEMAQRDRSSYYFSGKAESYKRAAEKVREILGK